MPVASADALIGLGLPAQLAELLGGNPSQLTGVGTTNATTAIVKSKNTELVTAGGNTACIIPATPDTSQVMVPYNITVQTATTGLVFVPATHAINGSTVTPLSIPANKSAIIWQYKPKFWAAVVSA